MAGRKYGQFCGLARALELIGERWALLVVRDLILGPKTFTELRRTLAKIPPSILSCRLNELEQAGVVLRRVQPKLEASVTYELTEYGGELREIVRQLGLWGARSLGEQGTDLFTLDSAILWLYTTFRPEFAKGVRVCYELRYGDMVVHARIDDGDIEVGAGPWPGADLVIEPRASIKPLLAAEIGSAEALNAGTVRVTGDPRLLGLFADMFHIPPAPQRPVGRLLVH